MPAAKENRKVSNHHTFMSESSDITQLLKYWTEGNREAEVELIKLLYPMFHKMARNNSKRDKNSSALQTTEIVNEAFIRLKSKQALDWENRQHFYAIAARIIRNIIVDEYRARMSIKRGGDQIFVTLNDISHSIEDSRDINWLEIDQLIERLSSLDPKAAEVIELRYFAGLTVAEIAEHKQISVSTVERLWRFAKSWLHVQLSENT